MVHICTKKIRARMDKLSDPSASFKIFFPKTSSVDVNQAKSVS